MSQKQIEKASDFKGRIENNKHTQRNAATNPLHQATIVRVGRQQRPITNEPARAG